MTIATITKLVKDRGFGFSKDDNNQLYFFHYSAIDPKTDIKFESLEVGNKISFLSMDSDKGPRATPRTLTLV